MDINKLNDAWIQAGQRVDDLNAKVQTMLLDDSVSAEDLAKAKSERDDAKVRRDALHDELQNAREEEKTMKVADKNVAIHTEEGKKEHEKMNFANQVKGLIKGDPKVMNLLTETDTSGNQLGLVVPEDIQVQIHELIRQYASLEQYVTTESVSMPSGSRVYEKWKDITPLANLDDDAAQIGDNDDPELTKIKYQIHRYAGISTITNTLLNDSPDNLLAWVEKWIARKSVVTRNNAILAVLPKLSGKAKAASTLSSYDDVKTLINTGVDPAIASTSFLMTNVSGFNELAHVKDGMGRYMIQPDITKPNIYQLEGKNVVVISDRWLPDDSSNNHPMFYGDLKQAVTLFDRQQMSLLTTNIGGGAFEKDETKIRVIDRFDVEATDGDAFVPAYFKLASGTSASTSSAGK